ncbi:MAG: Unknown protein [uncultured Aureispira sp.]|uniref:DUF7793 domain-containing protein n=1 Tax=uncultured Aureispira sp. TaxID=1331704 RepID=A0A6S6TWP1_9BACT|nr:MAG: Unknown protein [uncultured Aureispira sp.]
MEFETKEFVIQFLDERILIMKPKENLKSATKEGAVECLEKMKELTNSNTNSKAIITHVASLYIKKDAMRVFSDEPTHEDMRCSAIVSTSFIARNMAGIFLRMRKRFIPNDIPMQIFNTEEAALKWVYSILDSTP